MLKKGIVAFMMMGTLALANPVKMVFDVHTVSDARFHLVMNNLRNAIHDTGNNPKNLQIYVVFYGPGIKYMLNSLDNTPFAKDTKLANNLMDLQMQLQAYQQEGVVHFRVCHESLNAYHISPKDVVSFAKVVPAGILEIAKLEHEGYAYVRP
jgi:intracellular sulfur oxidation DsrE/DsrF family protein